ncbi:MAG: GNAT family acetyltransferase [Bacteroidetes bacterium]|nr:GNAT family acetyltransferase [Bacteroidota bacterium]
MYCKNAVLDDLDAVLELQSKYHINTIQEQDKSDGFVTTLFTGKQLQELIDKEKGLFLLIEGQSIIGYAMSGSWEYWKSWPMFQHMIGGLGNLEYLGQTLNTSNTYQYGPICIDKRYRGTGALEKLFDFARCKMALRFPILITFINKANPRSVAAHEKKLGLETIKEFDYNSNQYLEMAYDTSKELDF